jgi:hypothetical protein
VIYSIQSTNKDRAELLGFFSQVSLNLQQGTQNDLSPLQSLECTLRAVLKAAPLPPNDRQITRADIELAHSSAFEMLSSHLRAAQRAGELKDGDPSRIATLILCVVLGAMRFAQRLKEPLGRQDAEPLPTVLLHLLAPNRCLRMMGTSGRPQPSRAGRRWKDGFLAHSGPSKGGCGKADVDLEFPTFPDPANAGDYRGRPASRPCRSSARKPDTEI